MVRHRDQLLPGAQKTLVSDEVFQQAQLNLRRNSGRSETLSTHLDREYLLKGLVRCAHYLLPSGHRPSSRALDCIASRPTPAHTWFALPMADLFPVMYPTTRWARSSRP